jgi:hypothetical protein
VEGATRRTIVRGWAPLSSVGNGDGEINCYNMLLKTQLMREKKSIEIIHGSGTKLRGDWGDKRIIISTKSIEDVGDNIGEGDQWLLACEQSLGPFENNQRLAERLSSKWWLDVGLAWSKLESEKRRASPK